MSAKHVFDVLFGSALFFNAALFIPQAWRIYKHKTASEASLITFGGFNLIQLLAIFNGIYDQDYALAIDDLISLLTCGLITIQIILDRFKTCRLKNKNS